MKTILAVNIIKENEERTKAITAIATIQKEKEVSNLINSLSEEIYYGLRNAKIVLQENEELIPLLKKFDKLCKENRK